jgi:hypothetical protein
VGQEALDRMTQERLAGERQVLLRQAAAEALATPGRHHERYGAHRTACRLHAGDVVTPSQPVANLLGITSLVPVS